MVISMILMAFIVLLILSLATFTKIEAQTVATAHRLSAAKANAIFGLNVAVGELQRLTGPDTRVTARAEILGVDDSSSYRYWTGVWGSKDADASSASTDHTERWAFNPANRKQAMAWLVSGLEGNDPEDIDPEAIEIPENKQVELVSGDSDSNIPSVIAGKQQSDPAHGSGGGSFAWWVGDEGVKVRINQRDALDDGELSFDDLVGPGISLASDTDKLKLLSAQIAQKTGAEHIDELSARLQGDDTKDALSRVLTMQSLDLLLEMAGADESVSSQTLWHDVTAWSKGLLTDVRKGGFKKDLTLAFDDADVFEQYFGVRPTDAEVSSSLQALYLQSYNFEGAADEFFLTPEIISMNGVSDVGPNWGSLYHYYHLYELPGISDGVIKPIAPWPFEDRRSPVRIATFPPYSNYQASSFIWEQDGQHWNSPIGPILERIKLIVRVGAVATTDDEGNTKFKLRFYIQPLVGLWNPYNISLSKVFSTYYRYRLDCEAAPEFVISGTYEDGTEFNETVNIAKGYGHSDYNQTEGYWSLLFPQDLDFKPGEIRLFSTTSSSSSEIQITGSSLDYGWDETDGFYVDWPYDPTEDSNVNNDDDPQYLSDLPVTIHSVSFKDRTDSSSSNDYAGAFIVLKHTLPGSDADTGHLQRVSAIWKDSLYNGGSLEAGGVEEGTIAPFFPSSVLDQNYKDIGAWLFHLRTTDESEKGIRNGIDGNLRALSGSARWDGPGLFALAPFAASGDNGYLAPGSTVEPTFGKYGPRYTGINGASISDYQRGVSNIALFDVPRSPLVSVGQFQHANLARYSFEPSYIVGNSYANIRVPLDEVVSENFDGQSGVNLFDTSYMVNDLIFDEYFFSTIDPDLDDVELEELHEGTKRLYNTRYSMVLPLNADVEDILGTEEKTSAWGGRFIVDGAFNVNSTSVDAWKAVLSSMDQPYLGIDVDSDTDGVMTLKDPDGVYISRLTLPIFDNEFMGNEEVMDFFQGVRKLSSDELQSLAEAVVEEVKSRGPFLSMSDFVNRRLVGSQEEQQRGALQAALDRTVNDEIEESLKAEPEGFNNSAYSEGLQTSGEWTDLQAAGDPGYVLQGDILQVLAPVLSVRSDTFVIRSYGSSEGIAGDVSDTWCEAIVQRMPDMVGTGNTLSDSSIAEFGRVEDELLNEINQHFGRSYRIVSFRWLNEDEI